MPKTLTVRMDDATYRLVAEAAAADNRSVSNFIETAAREKAAAEIFVPDDEMAEIRSNADLVKRLKRGHREAAARRGRFV
jgi:predicted transcriptional regulator